MGRPAEQHGECVRGARPRRLRPALILLDTSGLLAAFFPDQRDHGKCAEALLLAKGPPDEGREDLAELDYLVAKLAGAARDLVQDVELHLRSPELVDVENGASGRGPSVEDRMLWREESMRKVDFYYYRVG